MTAKLLAVFLHCFDDQFTSVRAEACITCGLLRIRDERVITKLCTIITDELIHRVKALAIQGLFCGSCTDSCYRTNQFRLNYVEMILKTLSR